MYYEKTTHVKKHRNPAVFVRFRLVMRSKPYNFSRFSCLLLVISHSFHMFYITWQYHPAMFKGVGAARAVRRTGYTASLSDESVPTRTHQMSSMMRSSPPAPVCEPAVWTSSSASSAAPSQHSGSLLQPFLPRSAASRTAYSLHPRHSLA